MAGEGGGPSPPSHTIQCRRRLALMTFSRGSSESHRAFLRIRSPRPRSVASSADRCAERSGRHRCERLAAGSGRCGEPALGSLFLLPPPSRGLLPAPRSPDASASSYPIFLLPCHRRRCFWSRCWLFWAVCASDPPAHSCRWTGPWSFRKAERAVGGGVLLYQGCRHTWASASSRIWATHSGCPNVSGIRSGWRGAGRQSHRK